MREDFCNCHTARVEITGILSRIFGKNFVKLTVLLNKWNNKYLVDLTKYFFGEESKFFIFPHCAHIEIFFVKLTTL